MSGTTDSPVAAPPVPLPAAARGTAPAPGASVAELIQLTQGFYFIFWGLLVTVLVAAQIVVTLWLRTFAEVFLIGAVLAMLIGVGRLRRARLAGAGSSGAVDAWRRSVAALWFATLLLGYFSLLFYLWRRLPSHPYLQANALGFVACGLVLLVLLNLAVSALARVLGRPDLAVEARWFAAANLVLLALPVLGAAWYVVAMAGHHHTNVLMEFQVLLARLNIFVLVVLLLPLSLTLSLVWAAKDLALRGLTAGSPAPADVGRTA